MVNNQTAKTHATSGDRAVLGRDAFITLGQRTVVEFVDLSDLMDDDNGQAVGVYVRALTARDRDKIIKQGTVRLAQNGDRVIDLSSMPADTSIEILLSSIVTDETGSELMFRRGHKGDREIVGAFSGAIVDRIVGVVRRISGLDDEAVEEAKND